MELVKAVILGLVEGLTEFLPVSSTGHLILSSAFMDINDPVVDTFLVVIQLGAILAVIALYWSRFWGLLFPVEGQNFSGPRGILMLFLTCLPAGLLGLFAHSYIKSLLFSPLPVAIALATGAVFMILLERRQPKPRYLTLDDMNFKVAFGIGCFQCLALWPGFSRSASTIMGGMILGAERKLAAEYSFIAAVPIMFAATGYDLYKSWNLITVADLPFFAVGFVVAFLSALAAIKVFINLLGRLGLTPFALYRILLALAVLIYFF